MRKKVDIVVVIPSYNPGLVVGDVVKKIDSGLSSFYSKHTSQIVIVDSSNKDLQRYINDICCDLHTETKCFFYSKRYPKGAALITGFKYAEKLSPKVVIMVDSDLKSLRPDWVKSFVDPILANRVDFIGPNYLRDKYDGLITNHIAFPVLKSYFNSNLRQPIGGDFSFSGDLLNVYLNSHIIPKEAKGFGIDIWLTFITIANGFRMGQTYLGTKDHGVTIKDPLKPEESLGTMFFEVVKTLFDLVVGQENISGFVKQNNVKNFGKPITSIPKSFTINSHYLWSAFQRLYPEYSNDIEHILDKNDIVKIHDLLKTDDINTSLDINLWSKILSRYLLYYRNLTNKSEKCHTIKSLLPLYFARIACFANETSNLNNKDAEEKIIQNVEIFRKTMKEMNLTN